jgi:hypothetical protein
MSFLLLVSMTWMARRQTAADPPGDLHVRLFGGDREAAVLEPGRYPCAGRRLESCSSYSSGGSSGPASGGNLTVA